MCVFSTCPAGSAWSRPWAGFTWTGSANFGTGSLRVLSSWHLQKCCSVTSCATQLAQWLHAAAEGCSSSGQPTPGLSLCTLLHPAELCLPLLDTVMLWEVFRQFSWVSFSVFGFNILWVAESALWEWTIVCRKCRFRLCISTFLSASVHYLGQKW